MGVKGGILVLAGAALVSGTAIFFAAQSARGLTQMKGELCTQEIDAKSVTQINIQPPIEYGLQIVSGDDDYNISLMYYNTLSECVMEKNDNMVRVIPTDKKNKWYDYIRFEFIAPKRKEVLKISIPPDLYAEISANVRFGDVEINGVMGDTLHLNTNMGDVNILASDFDVYDIDSNRGDINMSGIGNRNDKGYAMLKTGFGEAEVKNAKLSSLVVSNTYGDINIYDTKSVIKAYNRNGDIKADNVMGKVLRFKNEYGNISGSVDGSKESFVTNVNTEHGQCNVVPNKKGANLLEASASNGNIEFYFTQSDTGEAYDSSLEDILKSTDAIYY